MTAALAIIPLLCLTFGLARTYAQLAKPREALDALACAATGPGITADVVERALLLAPIRDDARYKSIVVELRKKAVPGSS